MSEFMNQQALQGETAAYSGTGGESAVSYANGFQPAFLDTRSLAVYLSRFSDGRLAPFHLLDGLPDAVVVSRNAWGRVESVRAGVVSGFVRDGEFYTREEAARQVAELH